MIIYQPFYRASGLCCKNKTLDFVNEIKEQETLPVLGQKTKIIRLPCYVTLAGRINRIAQLDQQNHRD